MKNLLAAFVLMLCAAFAGASAAACRDPGGIGGTGVEPGGTGGTGIDPGGIGGTGQSAAAEIGVLGVITGFGSICVNGIEVHYDANTQVALNGDLSSAGALRIGQVVSVLAIGSGTQARAHWIDVVDAAVGPVTGVENAGAMLQVNRERVRIEPSTVFGPGLGRAQLASAQAGDILRVSGLRNAEGVIVATRVETAPPGTRALAADPADPSLGRFLVEGYVTDAGSQAVRVGPTRFRVAPDVAPQLARGQLVRLEGRREGGNRIVERADFLSGPFDVRPQRTLRMEQLGPRSGDDRRGGGGGDGDRGGRDSGDRSGSGGDAMDRSGRDGGGAVDRVERVDRSGPGGGGDRVERIDRSGTSGGGNRPERVDRSGRR
ncbi:MAG TPA: DUF5666 domain-containing protein [Burkholderiales bacterium]|jgi:hypothetical protein